MSNKEKYTIMGSYPCIKKIYSDKLEYSVGHYEGGSIEFTAPTIEECIAYIKNELNGEVEEIV